MFAWCQRSRNFISDLIEMTVHRNHKSKIPSFLIEKMVKLLDFLFKTPGEHKRLVGVKRSAD